MLLHYFHLSHQEDGYSSRFGGAVKVSKKMFDMCNVKYTQYKPTGKKIELKL